MITARRNLICKTAALMMLVALTSSSIAHAGFINIELKDRVLLPKKQLVMGDLAVITTHDDALTHQINGIRMGHTPWPGNIRNVSRDIFYMRLSSEGIDVSNLTFSGTSKSVTVSVESITFTGQEIAEKAQAYLTSILPWDHEDVIVELERLPSDVVVPKGQGEVRLKVSRPNTRKDRGPIQLLAKVLVDGKVLNKFRIFFRVRIFEDVVVTKRQLRRKEILHKNDLFLKRTETTSMGGIIFNDIYDLVGKRTIRPIRPYTVVSYDMVETPPAIKKGDVIKLIIKKGSFMVVTKGISVDAGKKGDVIRVKNCDSKKQLSGTVIDSERVAIAF